MKGLVFTFLLLATANVSAQAELSMSEWLDLFVDSCVGSGSSSVLSGSIGADGELSLKKLNLNGSLEGKATVTKSNYRLLSEGISNKMNEVSAGQADKVRECLEPVRRNLLKVMSQQMNNGPAALQKPIYILSPEEDRVMQYLATTEGQAGL